MTTFYLKTPLSKEDICKLAVNDVVYLSGIVVTARDQAHRRALTFLREGKVLPVDLGGLVVFHCGPVMKKESGKWIAVAAGPTTSTRMESVEYEFVKGSKVRMIIGKGGMGKQTTEAMKKFGSVYCAFTGGAAVLAAKAIKRVRAVEWLDLGMPEALWVLEVDEFGPLVVAIDAHGHNLFADLEDAVKKNRSKIYRKFGF
jgi:fumarate hydratase subunit beta